MAETETEFAELTEIEDVIDRIHEHEAAIADLIENLPPLVHALRGIEDGARRKAIATHLY